MKRFTHEIETPDGDTVVVKLVPDTPNSYKIIRKWERDSNKTNGTQIEEEMNSRADRETADLKSEERYIKAGSEEEEQMLVDLKSEERYIKAGSEEKEQMLVDLKSQERYVKAGSQEKKQMLVDLRNDIADDYLNDLDDMIIAVTLKSLQRLIDNDKITDPKIRELVETDIDGEFWQNQNILAAKETVIRFRERTGSVRNGFNKLGKR